ncbi:MAG TPA: hypothetical protein VJN96_25300, partial [Vicinamibacterales bacterium]|nr:hypothetical protein [Vicinamibacterales bacterium]
MRKTRWFHVTLLMILAVGISVGAQQPARAITAADYARAEKFLAQNLTGLVVGGSVTPTWIGTLDDRFTYRNTRADGTTEAIVVDAVKKTRQVCAPGAPECAGSASVD